MSLPDQEELRSRYRYDPETGRLTYRRTTGRALAGTSVGNTDKRGYRCTTVRRRGLKVHRIIWCWMAGEWPAPDQDVDHRNGVPDDNRWANLRVISHHDNLKNVKRGWGSQPLGVSYDAARKKYSAKIGVDGRTLNLGRFPTAEQAEAAYLAAKQQYHIINETGATHDSTQRPA